MPKQKRNYAAMSLEEAMQLVQQESFIPWQLQAPAYPPSNILMVNLSRLNYFDLRSSEQAKTLLIDVLFAEIVPLHKKLKVWKEAALNTDTLTGVADYLIAPNRAYLAMPLLCVAEAKRDDFARGTAQCVAEMAACRCTRYQNLGNH